MKLVSCRPVNDCHDSNVTSDKNNHGVEVPIAETVGKENKGKEPRCDLTDAVIQEKQPTNRVCSKVEGPSFFKRLVDIDGPRQTQTRCQNCPKLHFWNV